MLKIKRIILISVLVAAVMCFSGCQTHEQSKKEIHQRWDQTSAKAKVPVAKGLFMEGNVARAEEILAECLRVAPEMAEANLIMGDIHFSQGRIDKAKSCFEAVVGSDAKCHEAWYSLAVITRQKGQVDKALDYYCLAMKLEPSNTKYTIAVANMFASQSDYDKALELLKSKISSQGSGVELTVAMADIELKRGNVAGAIENYNRALLLTGGQDTDIMAAMGYCYIMNKQWSKASELFEEIAPDAHGPRKKAYMQLLAVCAMNDRQYGKAIGYYDTLSVDDRDNPDLWLDMGQAALGTKSPYRAIACANRALELNPGWSEAIALKGCAEYSNSDYDKALATFKKVYSDKNKAGFAWLMSGKCYEKLNQLDRAKNAYEKAVKLNPDSKLVSFVTDNK